MIDNLAFGILIGIIFVSLLVLFCALLIKLYINKIKNYTRVIYQKDIDFQKILTTTILEAQEQVLNNVSQELHDDAGQQLTYINFMVENLKLDSPELTGPLEPISNSVHLLSNSIRRISHSLNSQMLVQQNLLKAIEGEADRLRQVSGLAIDYSSDSDVFTNFDPSRQIVIFRIFQEIINNAMKHSGATKIVIEVGTKPVFKLKVADNGRGFNYEASKSAATGLGLSNLISRAEIVGMDISIDSAPGKGTAITLLEI
ncbi:ATP-binding protein [Flavobacterium sp. DGU11]|uniref:histidine kinase n=1 Tax=Flavobacterium arundinis TaxID=3139143 RepID=A0ABU9I243_9FLAO